MKRVLLIFIVALLALHSAAFAREDYEKIYEELQNANFEYVFGIDPWQSEDYTKYIFSPYPLLRTSVYFRLKEILIPPGYYLLTPREREGKDWVLFKESGRVRFIVPVFKTELVEPLFYEKHVPTPKKTKGQKAEAWASRQISRISKSSMR
ncbi:hypothetical protein tpqmel_0905, partial [Candidatus Gastranaerophilus sp. (ex Termes propinquus)]